MKIYINNEEIDISEKDFVNEIGRALINAIGFDNSIHCKLKRTKAEHEQDSLQHPGLVEPRIFALETQWGKITLCTDRTDPKDIPKKNRIRGADGVTYYISGIDFDLPVSAKMGEDGVFRLYGKEKLYDNAGGANDNRYETFKAKNIDRHGAGHRKVVGLDNDKVAKIIARNQENESAQIRLPPLLKNEVEMGKDLRMDISVHSYLVHKESSDGFDKIAIEKSFITMTNMKKSLWAAQNSGFSIKQWFSILFQVIDLSLGLNEGTLGISERKLLHRDLKPDNFMVDTSFLSNGKVKSTEDDLSVALCDYETVTEIGNDNQTFHYGTEIFLPPEINRNDPPTRIYSFATEIYTLGATITDILLMIASTYFKKKNNIITGKIELIKESIGKSSYSKLDSSEEAKIIDIENAVSEVLEKTDKNSSKIWDAFCSLSKQMRKMKPEDRITVKEARQKLDIVHEFAQKKDLLPKNPRKVDHHLRQNYGYQKYKEASGRLKSCCFWPSKHGISGIKRAKALVDAFSKTTKDNDGLPDVDARKEAISIFFEKKKMKSLFAASAQNNEHSFIRYFLVAFKENADDLLELFKGTDVVAPEKIPKLSDEKELCKQWLKAFQKLAEVINMNKKDKSNSYVPVATKAPK